MTENDRKSLEEFLGKLRSARLPQQDPEAARMIDETFLVQPEAAQLLVLKCLLQQRALDELRQQLEALHAQAPREEPAPLPAPGSTQDRGQDRGWFARLLGAPPQRVAPTVAAPAAAPPYGAAGGSVLGSIATTAAGVAAGEFLFEGIGQLLHGGRGYGYGLGQGPLPGQPEVVENVTINEFGGGGAPHQAGPHAGGGMQDIADSGAPYGDQGGGANDDLIDLDSAGFDDSGSDDSFSI